MTPSDLIESFKSTVETKPSESRAFHELASSGAYSKACYVISRLILTCGDMALEQPEEVDYWRGVKFGLQAFFELTDNEAANYEALAAELTFNENTGANDGGEYDVSDAVSDIGMSLGSSPL